eukprot:GHVU01113075.1.p1 GENE.GHVU01113075.1~~GHVU01113075.1.p1  ORF type:complete len:196 (+),score=30.75 GHVU01113075.1:225-812(+)
MLGGAEAGEYVRCYYAIAAAEAMTNLARMDRWSPGGGSVVTETAEWRGIFGREVQKRLQLGEESHSSGSLEWAFEKRKECSRLLAAEFQSHGIDVIVTPTTLSTAPKIEDAQKTGIDSMIGMFLVPPSLAGIPALSAPMGLADSMPCGVQFIGPPWSEGVLLRVAYALEKKANWPCIARQVKRKSDRRRHNRIGG